MLINTDILESLILCKKNIKPSHFHDVIKTEKICFMPKAKSFGDSQCSEVFNEILFD